MPNGGQLKICKGDCSYVCRDGILKPIRLKTCPNVGAECRLSNGDVLKAGEKRNVCEKCFLICNQLGFVQLGGDCGKVETLNGLGVVKC